MDSRSCKGTRRRLLQHTIAGLASLALGVGNLTRSGTAASPAQQPDGRPNIVLILTDDMRVADLPYLPSVQKLLVEQGVTLTNFAAAAPGCGPARASIFRGQYPHSHGVLRGAGDNGGLDRFRGLGSEDSTVATWLQDAGYRTALVGKYLNGYGSTEELLAIPPGWDDWYGVSNEGYSRFTINEQGTEVRYTSREIKSKRKPKSDGEQHLTDVLAEKAVQVIADVAPAEQPFFMQISPRAPHGPVEPASWYLDAFPDVALPDHVAMNEADVSDKPNWVQVLPQMSEQDMADLAADFRARLQSLLSVDDLVAGVVAELEQQGVLENTYILFSSDNGFGMGEHRVAQEKGSPYEEAIMVPMVIRGPGISPGTTLDFLASQVDLAPTFAAWGGAEVPDFVEGRSLAEILAGEPVPDDWRKFQFIEHHTNIRDRTDKQPAFEELRTPQMVYVMYATGEQELYDMEADPHQAENLAAVVDEEWLVELRTITEAMWTCEAETCREIEQQPLPPWPARG